MVGELLQAQCIDLGRGIMIQLQQHLTGKFHGGRQVVVCNLKGGLRRNLKNGNHVIAMIAIDRVALVEGGSLLIQALCHVIKMNCKIIHCATIVEYIVMLAAFIAVPRGRCFGF